MNSIMLCVCVFDLECVVVLCPSVRVSLLLLKLLLCIIVGAILDTEIDS